MKKENKQAFHRFLGTLVIAAKTTGKVLGVGTAAWMLVGCPSPSGPEKPTAQSKTFSDVATVGGTVDVAINFTALPNVIPSYMANLETVVRGVLSGSSATGNLTINVIASGGDGFTLAGPKTLNVRESWLINATEMDMGSSLTSVRSSWVAMVRNGNVYIAIGGCQGNQRG